MVTLEVINTQVIINVFRNKQGLFKKIFQGKILIKVLCEQTRELTHDFLDYV